MRRLLTLSLLTLILALAAMARFHTLHHYCYFFDETWNDELSTGRGSMHIRLANDVLYENVPKPTSLSGAPAWYHVWTNIDHVTHPPLYLIVLRWWRDVFGESPIVSRSLSAVISTLAILLMFDVGRLYHGTVAALWACLIMALAGVQIELAQEVRPYTLLLLTSLMTLAALARIEKLGPSPRRSIALGVGAVAIMLTHYFGIVAAGAIGMYALIRLRGRARRDAIAAMLAASIVFAVAWGPFFWAQRRNFTAATLMWMREDPAGHVRRDLARLAEVPLRLLIEPPRHTFPLGYVAAISLPLPFLLLKRRPEMLIWCLWLCGTIFFIAALDLARSTQHLAYIRYSLIGSPAIYMPLAALVHSAAGATGLRRVLPHLVPGCIALSCLADLPEAYEVPKPEYRLLASYIDNNIQPGDAVVFYSSNGDEWFSSAMFLNTCYYSHAYPWPFVMMTHPPDASMRESLVQFNHVWLINRTASMSGEKLLCPAAVDGYQYFPYTGSCERITADPTRTSPRALVPPKPLWQLR